MAVPRRTVATSATGIRKKYAATKITTSAAPPIHKMGFDSGNFNFDWLLLCPRLFFAIISCPAAAALVPACSYSFESIIAKTPRRTRPFDPWRGVLGKFQNRRGGADLTI